MDVTDSFTWGYKDKHLKACRCGSERVRIQGGSYAQMNDYRVRCWDCRVTGVPMSTWPRAVEVWNETH